MAEERRPPPLFLAVAILDSLLGAPRKELGTESLECLSGAFGRLVHAAEILCIIPAVAMLHISRFG